MPTDALLIEQIEHPAAANGYYALVLNEDGLALRNHTVPYQLEVFTMAGVSNFVHNMPGDAQQPWRYWIKLLCANMNLASNPYGSHYTILVFARAAPAVANPAVDTLKQTKRVIWLQREAYSRLDASQEQIIAVLSGQAGFAADRDANDNIAGSWGQFLAGLPSAVVTPLAATLALIKAKTDAQPTELAQARYQVKSSAVYDDQTKRLAFVAWLEKDGELFPLVSSVEIVVRNSDDEIVATLNSVAPGDSFQFNVGADNIDLSPDEAYFVVATLTTSEDPPRIFSSAISLITWD